MGNFRFYPTAEKANTTNGILESGADQLLGPGQRHPPLAGGL
jgi:hypothetical protein